MTSFPDARALVLSAVEPLGTESVALDELGGRVLASPVICPFDIPLLDNSQVDGYAIRSADLGARLVVGVSSAGGPPAPRIGKGEAIRIFTGAPMPAGADAVVMQEDCQVDQQKVRTDERIVAGQFVRRQGEEIANGTTFDFTGRLATPPLVGLIASFGLNAAKVYRRPRVIVVGTGSELVPPGSELKPGQIHASNPAALAEALRAMGIPEVETRLVGDDPAETRRVFEKALSADVLITVGGVSVGDHDLVRPTLASLGVEERLWRVAMKPGKPFYFGQKGQKPIFGLPGNPVSALVTFHLLVRPALRRMLRLTQPEEETTAELGAPITRKDLRYEFVRATLANGVATPVEAQGSHMQTGLAFADALIHVPDGVSSMARGERVRITPLDWRVSR